MSSSEGRLHKQVAAPPHPVSSSAEPRQSRLSAEPGSGRGRTLTTDRVTHRVRTADRRIHAALAAARRGFGAGIIGVGGRRGAGSPGRPRDARGSARRPGLGATQASAGMLAPFTEAEPGSRPQQPCASRGSAATTSRRARPPRQRAAQFEVRAEREPWKSPSTRPRRTFARSRAGAGAPGIACTLARRRERGRGAPGADPIDARRARHRRARVRGVMPLPRALLQAARRTAQRRRGVTVRGSRAARGRLDVVAGRDTFEADHVVMLRGQLVATARRSRTTMALPVRPVRGQLLELRPRDPMASPASSGDRAAISCRGPTGAVLVGATVEDVGFDERGPPSTGVRR